jgi:hypothetical protein
MPHSSDGHVRLLLLPITMMGTLILADHCYCGARGTRAGATNAHSSDGSSDISGPLIQPPTVATGDMTSADHYYCWSRGTRAVATGAHSTDGLYDIKWPLLLWGTWHARVSTSPHNSEGLSDINGSLLLPPTVVTGYMTSDSHYYCWARGMRAVARSPHSNDGLAVHCYCDRAGVPNLSVRWIISIGGGGDSHDLTTNEHVVAP